MQLTTEKIEQAKKFISTDALLIIVMDALARRKSLSAVRMGDGEKSLILYSHGKGAAQYLNDPLWLKEYGLVGADKKAIGESLIKAGNECDYFCPNIYGIQDGKYDVTELVKPRKEYCEGLFAHTWAYMHRVEALIKFDGGVGVVSRDAKDMSERLFMKYGVRGIEHAEYNSWKDYDTALHSIGKMKAHLILVTAGASGKYLIVEAAKKFGKVVLDTGSALKNFWA